MYSQRRARYQVAAFDDIQRASGSRSVNSRLWVASKQRRPDRSRNVRYPGGGRRCLRATPRRRLAMASTIWLSRFWTLSRIGRRARNAEAAVVRCGRRDAQAVFYSRLAGPDAAAFSRRISFSLSATRVINARANNSCICLRSALRFLGGIDAVRLRRQAIGFRTRQTQEDDHGPRPFLAEPGQQLHAVVLGADPARQGCRGRRGRMASRNFDAVHGTDLRFGFQKGRQALAQRIVPLYNKLQSGKWIHD